jgi:hypothetical protein
MRLKVKRIIKKETAATAKGLVLDLELDPADHNYLLTKENGMLAMDLQPPEFLDEASLHASSILLETLNSGDLHDAAVIENYLAELHRRDSRFTNCIATASDGAQC